MRTPPRPVHVLGRPRPSGYSDGILAEGRFLFVAGQTGLPASSKTVTPFDRQFDRALGRVLEVVREAGGTAEDVIKLTLFVTRVTEYRAAAKKLNPIWRRRMGRHYPAISLIQVSALLDPKAKVEIEAVAAL